MRSWETMTSTQSARLQQADEREHLVRGEIKGVQHETELLVRTNGKKRKALSVVHWISTLSVPRARSPRRSRSTRAGPGPRTRGREQRRVGATDAATASTVSWKKWMSRDSLADSVRVLSATPPAR